MRQTQFEFAKHFKTTFGGSLFKKGKRKMRRPLSTKHPIHVVLRAAQSYAVFNPRSRKIEQLLNREAARFGIKLYDFAINWTHIHFVIKIQNRVDYIRFIRSLTSQLVRLFGRDFKNGLKGLFELRPYTQILTWGRQFKTALSYQKLNQLESLGLVKRCK